MSEVVIVDEGILERCMVCGKAAGLSIYEFYCSKECEDKDKEWIEQILDEAYPERIVEREAVR